MSSAAIATPVRRPATPGDADLLAELFAESRADDFALLPPDVRPSLVAMQFAAAQRSYRDAYPAARSEIIELDGRAVGRILIDATDERVRVVDVVVTGRARNRGIGTCVLREVIAAAGDRPVQLSVWSGNASARRLYARLGFHETTSDSGYVELVRVAGPHHAQG